MSPKTTSITRVIALSVTAVLAACGGGGGGTTASTAPTPAAPVTLATALVTSVPATTYTGEQANAFNLLNAERSRCGFGLLTQNAALDAAAAAHVNYTFVPGQDAHSETPGQPGFSGATVVDRANAKGYGGKATTTSEGMTAGNGISVVRGLLSGPYHMQTALDGFRDVGVAFQSNPQIADAPLFVINYGYFPVAGPQLPAGTDVLTYPCDGSTGIKEQLKGESPNPVPGRDLGVNPIGTPVLIKVKPGNSLVITNVSMVSTTQGTPVALRPVISGTALNDPNLMFLPNEAYVAPDAPLTRLTQYTVTFSGSNNGVVFTNRSFSFTTN